MDTGEFGASSSPEIARLLDGMTADELRLAPATIYERLRKSSTGLRSGSMP